MKFRSTCRFLQLATLWSCAGRFCPRRKVTLTFTLYTAFRAVTLPIISTPVCRSTF